MSAVISRPRVLITVRGGVADYESVGDVEVMLVDYDCAGEGEVDIDDVEADADAWLAGEVTGIIPPSEEFVPPDEDELSPVEPDGNLQTLDALVMAEDFILGFEDDDAQDEGSIEKLLNAIRGAVEYESSLVLTKHVTTITVIDPFNDNMPVELDIRKLDSGELVGLDGQYLEQVADAEQPHNPYRPGRMLVPDDEVTNSVQSVDASPIAPDFYYLDLPDVNSIRAAIGSSDAEGAWTNIGQFTTKAEAIAFIRANIGDCDEDGRISLLTEGSNA